MKQTSTHRAGVHSPDGSAVNLVHICARFSESVCVFRKQKVQFCVLTLRVHSACQSLASLPTWRLGSGGIMRRRTSSRVSTPVGCCCGRPAFAHRPGQDSPRLQGRQPPAACSGRCVSATSGSRGRPRAPLAGEWEARLDRGPRRPRPAPQRRPPSLATPRRWQPEPLAGSARLKLEHSRAGRPRGRGIRDRGIEGSAAAAA